MMYRGFGMFGGGGIVGLVLIAIVAFFAYKYLHDNKNVSDTFRKKDNALDILNERYAKGEIDDEEFNKRKKTLND
ncbi:MAG: SHOCT domain-containing protein [Gudongella sp.]|nr:SHOCT domain-containing protein [Gudongella sp.]